MCNNAWWRGFLFGFRHNARHDVSAPNKGGAKARRFSTTKYPQYSTIPNEHRLSKARRVPFNAKVTNTYAVKLGNNFVTLIEIILRIPTS